MRESGYQKTVLDKIREMFPGCVIMKNDANYIQGIQDWTIFWHDRWATLEIKSSKTAKKRPNQDYYVEKMNEMSFSAFIYPENEEEVLNDLQAAFRGRRKTLVSKS